MSPFALLAALAGAPLGSALETPAQVDLPTSGADPGSQPANEAGLSLALEPTLMVELYYLRLDDGIFGREGHTWARAGLPAMTGPSGYRLAVERWEGLVRAGAHHLNLLLGLRLTGARDPSASNTSLGGLIGLRYGFAFGRSEIGMQLAYQPAFVTWTRFSEDYQSVFSERYPEARGEPGEPLDGLEEPSLPEGAVVTGSAHRLQALLVYRLTQDRFSVWLSGGLSMSPGAGDYFSSLELGQVPVLLSAAWGYRF